MEGVVMLCEDVRRALPLRGGTDGREVVGDERDARLHAESCGTCSELLRAYDSDARALEAYREGRDADLPGALLDGFADSVMARLAEEPALADAPQGQVLRPKFNGVGLLLAVAAVLMLTASLALVLGARDATRDRGGGIAVTPTPTPTPTPDIIEVDVAPEAPVVDAPVVDAPGNALPAPRRKSAPTPSLVRRRGMAMPAGGGRRSMGSSPLADALRDLQRVFPNWDPSGMDRRVPRLRSGEREVRF